MYGVVPQLKVGGRGTADLKAAQQQLQAARQEAAKASAEAGAASRRADSLHQQLATLPKVGKPRANLSPYSSVLLFSTSFLSFLLPRLK